MTSVYAARAWPGGEALAIGTSCWIPLLQIERWAQGKAEARELPGVTLQQPSRIHIVSPDEVLLRHVTLASDAHGQLYRARLVRASGVWKLRDARAEEEHPGMEAALGAARKAAKEGGGLVVQSVIVGETWYHEVVYPEQGAPLERVVIRSERVEEAAEF
jgi:hypothetical protein